MVSERDIVAEARELAAFLAAMKEWRSQKQIRTEVVMRALADEVERLRNHIADLNHDFEAAVKHCNDHHEEHSY